MAAEAEAKVLKRAPSAYWIWLGEHREEVVQALGGVKKGSEVSKKAGEMWKALSEAQQAPYREKAQAAKEAFEADRPPKEPKAAQAADENLRKKPMTPVFAFIHEKRAEIAAMPEVKGLGEISKKGAELFKLLPEAEQAERHKRYEEEMKSYKEWQETDEGKAAMAGKKSAAAEVKAAKKEKVAKKRAKLARKEARAGKGSGAAAEAAPGAEAKAPKKRGRLAKATARAAKKSRAAATPEAEAKTPKKRVARAKVTSPPTLKKAKVISKVAEPELDAEVLKEAQALGLEAALKNLAGRKEVVESGKSGKAFLDALKSCNGLVNPAKRALLGA